MTAPDPDDLAREIFLKACDLTGDALVGFLDEACGDDEELRARVERLLDFDRRSAEASTTPHPPEPSTTPLQPGDERDPHQSRLSRSIGVRVGDSIDGFKILEEIGAGGMGVVYLAEQLVPVRRRIALKVIKPGMDSKAVLARFEAERQALALMDHPGIARVLQAGTTERGLPYFAMEYVKGVSLVEAADRHQLDTAQRLELMIEICDAVQHAHMKGVIHRDLKPSNILVTTDSNDRLVAKIIDFGVAKATTQQLTDLTVHTQVGHFIGTPAYMSPEQADLTAADIDTRTDVYSLGVILYELLTGQLPFDPHELREAGLDEMRRRIRDVDPPKPSTRLTGLDEETATRISKARRVRLDQLQKSLASELDWIPLKALRKLRSERYATPTDLGRDLRRYLDGEPLEAGPESAGYRLRKFVRRRRVPIVLGGAFAAILIAATAVSMRSVAVAEEARARAELREAEARTELERRKVVSEFSARMLEETTADVIAEVIRDGLSVQAISDGRALADSALAGVDCVDLGADVVLKGILEPGASRLLGTSDVDPLVAGELYLSMGTAARALGRWAQSTEYLGRSLDAFNSVGAGQSDLALEARLLRTLNIGVYADEAEFRKELSAVHELAIRGLGPDHAITQLVQGYRGLESRNEELADGTKGIDQTLASIRSLQSKAPLKRRCDMLLHDLATDAAMELMRVRSYREFDDLVGDQESFMGRKLDPRNLWKIIISRAVQHLLEERCDEAMQLMKEASDVARLTWGSRSIYSVSSDVVRSRMTGCGDVSMVDLDLLEDAVRRIDSFEDEWQDQVLPMVSSMVQDLLGQADRRAFPDLHMRLAAIQKDLEVIRLPRTQSPGR